jgi:hypothetical protein
MIVGAVFLAEVRAVSRSPIDRSWFRRPFHSDCNYGEGVNYIGVKMGAESDVAFCSLRTHVKQGRVPESLLVSRGPNFPGWIRKYN